MGDFDDINVKINVDASGAEQGLTRVSTSLNKLNSDVGKLGTGADFGDKLNSESKQAEGGLDKLGEAAEQANQKLAKVGSGLNLSAVGSQLDALSGKMQAWGAGLSILAAPFELVGAASVNAFADFEAGMAKIFTLMPDITEQAMGEISQQMKDFSMEMGADLGAAQQAAYDALSAGISPDNMMKFLEVAQKAGVAGMSDVSVSVDGLTSIMNAYGLSVEDATGVSDVMFKSVEKGKIEFDEFAANIGKVAPSAAGLGVVFEDVAAMIAQITSLGVSPSETMTAINSLMKDLASPAADIYQLFEQLTGKAFTDFVKEGGSVIDALEIINDYMIKTGKNAHSLTMNAETAKALSNLTGGNMENLLKFSEDMDKAAGSTEKAYSKVANTLQFAMDKLKAQFDVMGVEIGEALAPTVEKFTTWLSENADEIKNFAVGIAESAVPALEKLFDVLKGGMDAFNGMSPETKAMLAKLIGVGAVGAAVAGPGLLIGGTVLSPVASIVKLLGSLKVPATVATEVGAIGTAASTAAGAGGVGMLSTAITALGGPVVLGALAVVGIGLAAYATNFGDFRDNVNEIISDIGRAGSNIQTGNYKEAGRACGDAFVGGLESVADLVGGVLDPDTWIAVGDFVTGLGEAIEEGLEGFGASLTAAGIDVGGRLMEAIGDGAGAATSALSSMGGYIMESVMSGINNPGAVADMICDGINNASVNISSFVQNLESQILKGNWGEIGASAAQLVVDAFKVVNPVVGALAQGGLDEINGKNGTTTGTTQASGLGLANKPGWVDPHAAYQENKALLSDASDVISKLAEDKDISYESAKKMYDSSENLRKSLEMKYTEQPAGTPSDPITITAPVSTPTTASVVATSVSTGTFERPSGNIPDLFTRDPARYFENAINPFIEGWAGSVEVYEDYLKESGKSLEDKAREIFYDAKSNGFGGGVNWDDWWSEAQAGLPISIATLQNSFKGLESVFQTLEKTVSDGSASSSEAERYLDEYNKSTGKTTEYTQKQTSQTKDLMNAYSSISNAQDLYNKYMDDGVLSTSEATTVNAALAQGIDLMGSAGADTKDKIAGLPPALKELASSIMDFFNQIKSSVAQAQQESLYDDGWRTATNSSYESMTDPRTGKPVGRSYLDIDVILGLKEGPAKVDSLTESNKALQNSMYANVGTAGLLSSAYQAAGTAAIETMNNVVNAAADKISQANAVINNLSYSNSGNSISASNYMPGMTSYQQGDGRQMFSGFRPGWRNPSPCGWGSAFESGGKVSETGTALVHEGEYILSRNEVERMGKGGANINLNVNMNNSRFGNAEMAKDLPKLFAKATRRAFVARGYV